MANNGNALPSCLLICNRGLLCCPNNNGNAVPRRYPSKWPLKRFTGFFDRSDLIMASITLPQFKLCWLDDSGKEQARSLLRSYARTMQQQQLSDNDSGSDDGHISQEDDFFLLWQLPSKWSTKIVDTIVSEWFLQRNCKTENLSVYNEVIFEV